MPPSSNSFRNLVVIKTGQSETFQQDQGLSISLGDVLRTTVLLREAALFSQVYWITSAEAQMLVPPLDNLKVIVFKEPKDLDFSNLDQALILNLEKTVNIVEKIKFSKSSKWIGFKNDTNRMGSLQDINDQIWDLTQWNVFWKENGNLSWGRKILKLIGSNVSNSTGLYPTPSVEKKYDVGLNWMVGPKWPSKQMPENKWRQIESALVATKKVGWQQGQNHLSEYANWIASCRLIISTDSLGLHLALCMGIPTIGLFGSTDLNDVDIHGPAALIEYASPCLRCEKPLCAQAKHCSDFLMIEEVIKAVEKLNS